MQMIIVHDDCCHDCDWQVSQGGAAGGVSVAEGACEECAWLWKPRHARCLDSICINAGGLHCAGCFVNAGIRPLVASYACIAVGGISSRVCSAWGLGPCSEARKWLQVPMFYCQIYFHIIFRIFPFHFPTCVLLCLMLYIYQNTTLSVRLGAKASADLDLIVVIVIAAIVMIIVAILSGRGGQARAGRSTSHDRHLHLLLSL